MKIYQATIYQLNDALRVAEEQENLALLMALEMAKKGLEANIEAGMDTVEVAQQ